MMKKVAIIACEPSGDQIGAKLMNALGKSLHFEASGIGGEAMMKEGFHSLFDMKEFSVMGFTEVLFRIPKIIFRITQLIKWIKEYKPDVLVTIDAPGFNYRFVKKLRKVMNDGGLTFPIIQYVAPTVWAYAPDRAKYFANLYDHILTILPFEKQYFDDVGLPCTYVGHPASEHIKIKESKEELKARHGLLSSDLLVMITPGSRKQEVLYHLDVVMHTIEKLIAKHPQIYFFIPTFGHLLDIYEKKLSYCSFRDKIFIETDVQSKIDMMYASDVACVKSGTIAMEVAFMHIPMVMFYKLSKISASIIKRKIKIKYINILNLMADKMIIPELIQENFTVARLFDELNEIILTKGAEQLTAAREMMMKLSAHNSLKPSELAADAIIKML